MLQISGVFILYKDRLIKKKWECNKTCISCAVFAALCLCVQSGSFGTQHAGQRPVTEAITDDRTAERACCSEGPEAAAFFRWLF